jgi:hypothetical protein
MGQLPPVQLRLLGGFALSIGGVQMPLPVHARRAIAYLSAVRSRRPDHSRGELAAHLWQHQHVRAH